LNSDVSGLKVSSAYYLGEMKSEKAVIPIMKLFRETNNDGARLVAAWSLFKIGDERGVFLVKRYIELGDCDGIRCMLQHMYMDYSLKTYGKVAFN
jgi:HEAT repeat protein